MDIVPEVSNRESNNNHADPHLRSTTGQETIIEVKVRHVFDDDQQNRYEKLGEHTALYLVALAMDRHRRENLSTDRWTFFLVWFNC